jgi:hypothetical protein
MVTAFQYHNPHPYRGASNNVAIMPYYVDHEEPSSVSEAWKKIRESNQMRELIHNVIGEMQ